MMLSHCPKCNDEVRVPSQISPQATLKCPLCGESFEATVVLSSLPPVLEVVHDPAPPTLPAVPAPTSSEGFQGIDVETESAYDHVGEQVPAFEFDESEAPQRDAPSFVPEESPIPTRPNRRQRSPIPQIAGIVLGGLASIPLAQLCLWWVFSTDPVDLGPSVGRYVPFIVPAKFRAVAQVEETNETGERQPATDTTGPRSRTNSGKKTLLSPDDPSPFDDSGKPTKSSGSSVPPPPDEAGGAKGGSPPTKSPKGAPGKFPSGQLSPPQDNSGAGVLGVDFQPTEPNPLYENLHDPTSALRARRIASPTELYQTLQTVMDGYDAWASESSRGGLDRGQQLDQFYQSLCELGSGLLYLDLDDPQAVQAANTVRARLEDDFEKSTLRQFVANRAARRLSQRVESEGDGLALAGTVTEIKREGDLLVTTIRMGDTSRTEVQVYGWRAPPEVFKVDSTVVVLGARLSNPKDVLPSISMEQEAIAGAYLFVCSTTSR